MALLGGGLAGPLNRPESLPLTLIMLSTSSRMRGFLRPGTLAFEWIPTNALSELGVEHPSIYSGLSIAPGSPYRSMDGALSAVRFARERGVPLLGT